MAPDGSEGDLAADAGATVYVALSRSAEAHADGASPLASVVLPPAEEVFEAFDLGFDPAIEDEMLLASSRLAGGDCDCEPDLDQAAFFGVAPEDL